MPPIMLPPPTRETDINVRELSWAKDMTPTSGGKNQRQARLGTRHAIGFSIPVLRYAWCGAKIAAQLAMGRTGDGAAMIIPEPGVGDLGLGNGTVDGSPQLGSTINVKGWAVGKVIPHGKWLNLISGGRYYAYFTTAEVTVDANGKASLPVYPMIRRSAPDNSEVRIFKPLIQGLIKEPVQRKIVRRLGIGLNFEIEEQE